MGCMQLINLKFVTQVYIFLSRLSGIKLWLPQIFTSISQYQSHHNGSSASLCEMLGTKSNGNSNTVTCEAVISEQLMSIKNFRLHF